MYKAKGAPSSIYGTQQQPMHFSMNQSLHRFRAYLPMTHLIDYTEEIIFPFEFCARNGLEHGQAGAAPLHRLAAPGFFLPCVV